MNQSMKTIRTLFLGASVIALLAFDVSGAAAQLNGPIQTLNKTLGQAVQTGIATHPQYEDAAASRRATDEELAQGRSLFLPSVDVRADAGVEYTNDSSTRSGSGSDSESLERYDASITLSQMLFDGWDSHYEVERQKARVQSSAHRVRETAEFLSLSIVESYLEVLRQRQILVITRQNVGEHQTIMAQIKDGVDAGRSTRADLEQARARLAAAMATEASTLEALRSAEAQYKNLVGVDAGDLTLPDIPYGHLSNNVDSEVEVVLANSPTLDIYEADIERAYAESEQTKAAFYPDFDLELNARRGDNLGGVEGRDTSASALVVMNWNLYRGGGDTAREREFIHRHQQSKSQRGQAARQLEEQVRRTWASMVSSAQRAEEFARQADANVQVVRAYKDQFSLDRRTLLDVLDAQNELFVSNSNTVNAEFLEVFAVYRLLALKGGLLSTLGLAYEEETQVVAGDEWLVEEKIKAR